jgi:hypothetical protein
MTLASVLLFVQFKHIIGFNSVYCICISYHLQRVICRNNINLRVDDVSNVMFYYYTFSFNILVNSILGCNSVYIVYVLSYHCTPQCLFIHCLPWGDKHYYILSHVSVAIPLIASLHRAHHSNNTADIWHPASSLDEPIYCWSQTYTIRRDHFSVCIRLSLNSCPH